MAETDLFIGHRLEDSYQAQGFESDRPHVQPRLSKKLSSHEGSNLVLASASGNRRTFSAPEPIGITVALKSRPTRPNCAWEVAAGRPVPGTRRVAPFL
jgi:hypothetical protein